MIVNTRKLNKKLISHLSSVLRTHEFVGTTIQSINAFDHTLEIIMILPPKRAVEDLQEILPNLKQELNANDVKVYSSQGKAVSIHLGMRDLSQIKFDSSYIQPNTLKILLPSSYGHEILDFTDGASCHLLNGGATRMGKTSLWYYLCTTLYLQNPDSIQFLICSTKSEDFYMYQKVPNFSMADTDTEVYDSLKEILQLKENRKSLLRSLGNVKDHNGVRERYPHLYTQFHPIFVLIDEYGAYSENKPIQSQVMELVERGGSYNIHVLISAQRPDARTVLPARIKANLLSRICFTTADENNSIVILDQAGAEKLGGIPGRAIFQNGFQNIVQIPKLTDDKNHEIMKPYQKECTTIESVKTETRQSNPELTNKIQNRFSQSNRINLL